MRIWEVLTAPQSPWQNAYAERLIGSIRRECLNHFHRLERSSSKRTWPRLLRYYHQSRLTCTRKQCPIERQIMKARRDRRKFQNSAASTIVTTYRQREIEIGRINERTTR